MEVDLNKWFHCKVDKEEFVKLLQRSDYQGFKHMFIFFGSLLVFGYLYDYYGNGLRKCL